MKKIEPIFFSNIHSNQKSTSMNKKILSKKSLPLTERSSSHENIKKNNGKVLE